MFVPASSGFFAMSKYSLRIWLFLVFHAYNRHILTTLYPLLLFVMSYTTLLCYLLQNVDEGTRGVVTPYLEGTASFLSLLGVILGLFMVFRCNTAYDKWWEGRKSWGEMVNNTRYFAMKVFSYLPQTLTQEKNFFALMVVNFVYATKEHLREGVKMSELTFENEEQKQRVTLHAHKPNAINLMMCEKMNALYEKKYLTGELLIVLDKELKKFTDILGACERIKNTPIPFSFGMYIKKFIFIYTLIFPMAFVPNFGYFSIIFTAFLFYVLAGIEVISEEIEDPFGLDENDLPLEKLCGNIKRDVREILLKEHC